VLDPLEQSAVVYSQKMDTIVLRQACLKGRKKLVKKFVGRATLPGCRAVQVHRHHPTVWQLRLKYAFRGRTLSEADPSRKVLEQSSLSVSRVSTKDDQSARSFFHVAPQGLLERRLYIRLGSKL
jgi:hypothetical protein